MKPNPAIGRAEFLFLQLSCCKPMMAIEVCCHDQELLLEAKVCWFCQEFFISVFFLNLWFYLIVLFLFC
jgi:hypothetical protein